MVSVRSHAEGANSPMPPNPAPDIVARLSRCAVFSVLPPESLHRVAAATRVVELEPRVRLFSKGDEGDAAYVVMSGELEVCVQAADGREVWLATQKTGAVVGELTLLDGLPRAADVTATRRSRLLRIARADVLEALRSEPEAAIRLLGLLTRRLRQADALLEERSLSSLGGRLAKLLTQAEAGRVTLTQTEMARIIGASREKVNRKLREWKGQGWIEITRSGLRVADRGALEGLIGR